MGTEENIREGEQMILEHEGQLIVPARSLAPPDGIHLSMSCGKIDLPMSQDFLSDHSIVLTTWDRSTEEGADREERHTVDAKRDGENWINKTMDIVAVSVRAGTLVDDKGEEVTTIFTSIETDKGDIFSLTGSAIADCLIARMRRNISRGPIDEQHPMRLELQRVKCKNDASRSYYWFARPKQ